MHTPLKLILGVAALGLASATCVCAARESLAGAQPVQIEATGTAEFEFEGRPQDYVVPVGVCRDTY